MKRGMWHIGDPFFLANLRRLWLALGIFLFCAYAGFPQSSTNDLAHRLKTAKKIGLVLGGGGARGLAHVGAIIALEEYGIYPKVLGGTSMGAIVGSVYAMGYTPRQMDSIFKMLDYNDIFFRSYKKEYPSIFFREFENNSLLHANMNGWKAEIPSSYSSSLPMEHLYNLLLVDQRKYDNFSSLDKEFYCIGTNVYQRKAATFDKGALISSVLSSSAYPFIFSPQKKGADYFIDGGIFDNFPVDGMEHRGVDFIIGVDVSDRSDSLHVTRTKHPSWDRLLEALLVNGEDTSMQSKVNKCQIYVHPSVDSISSFDFSNPHGIIMAGYLEMTKVLASLGIEKENSSSFYKERAKNYLYLDKELRKTNVYIDTVEYLFSEKVSPVYQRQLQTFFPLSSSHPTRFNVDYVRQAMDVIYNTNNYEAINYSYFKKNAAHTYGLRINAMPKQVKYELLASASFSDLFGGEFMLGYLNRNLFFRNSYLSFQFVFGSAPRYNLNYYLDRGAIPSFGFSSQFYFYSFSNKFDEQVLREKDALPPTSPAFVYPRYGQYTIRNQFYIKSTIHRSLGIQAGAEYNWMIQKNDDKFGRLNVSSIVTNVHQINLFGRVSFSTLNDKLFTHHGVSTKGEFKILDLQDKIGSYAYSLFFEGIFALPVSRKINFLLKARLANIFNFSGEVTTLNMFKLGGAYEYNIYNTSSFMGYRNLELFTRGYMYGFAGINYQPFKKFYVMFGANIANVMRRQSSLFLDFYKLDYVPFGMGLMLGYDSAVAPFMVGVQYSPEGGALLTFRLGYIY